MGVKSMNKNEFLEYLLDNVSYLNAVEKRLLVEFVASANESFLNALFSKLLESKMIDLKNINALYTELLENEALKLARVSKVKFSDKNDRYKYDPLELLKKYYFEKFKNNELKKGK